MARTKRKLKPFDTKWAHTYSALDDLQHAIEAKQLEPARAAAKKAAESAGRFCHHPDRARSIGLAIETTIDGQIIFWLTQAAALADTSRARYLGVISGLRRIIEREVGRAIEHSQKRREVTVEKVGFADSGVELVLKNFNKHVGELARQYREERIEREREEQKRRRLRKSS